MPEEKIKIKDLAGELDVQSKDMLRALRDLGLPAKTTAGSVSVEDAARLRDHFAGRKQGGGQEQNGKKWSHASSSPDCVNAVFFSFFLHSGSGRK